MKSFREFLIEQATFIYNGKTYKSTFGRYTVNTGNGNDKEISREEYMRASDAYHNKDKEELYRITFEKGYDAVDKKGKHIKKYKPVVLYINKDGDVIKGDEEYTGLHLSEISDIRLSQEDFFDVMNSLGLSRDLIKGIDVKFTKQKKFFVFLTQERDRKTALNAVFLQLKEWFNKKKPVKDAFVQFLEQSSDKSSISSAGRVMLHDFSFELKNIDKQGDKSSGISHEIEFATTINYVCGGKESTTSLVFSRSKGKEDLVVNKVIGAVPCGNKKICSKTNDVVLLYKDDMGKIVQVAVSSKNCKSLSNKTTTSFIDEVNKTCSAYHDPKNIAFVTEEGKSYPYDNIVGCVLCGSDTKDGKKGDVLFIQRLDDGSLKEISVSLKKDNTSRFGYSPYIKTPEFKNAIEQLKQKKLFVKNEDGVYKLSSSEIAIQIPTDFIKETVFGTDIDVNDGGCVIKGSLKEMNDLNVSVPLNVDIKNKTAVGAGNPRINFKCSGYINSSEFFKERLWILLRTGKDRANLDLDLRGIRIEAQTSVYRDGDNRIQSALKYKIVDGELVSL